MTFIAAWEQKRDTVNQSNMDKITYNSWAAKVDAMICRLECVFEAITKSDPYEVIANAEIRKLDLLGLELLTQFVSQESEYIRDWHVHKESGNTTVHQSILRLKSNKTILNAAREVSELANLGQLSHK